MSEDIPYADIGDMDRIENIPEQLMDTEENVTETMDENESFNQDSEAISEETPAERKQTVRGDVTRTTRLPIGRIKNIMKMDPDVNLVNADAAFLVTKATELFLETLAKETYAYTATKKRKTIAKKDLDITVNLVDCLCFLDGALDI